MFEVLGLSGAVLFPILVLTPWRWFTVISVSSAAALGCGWSWFLTLAGEVDGPGVASLMIFIVEWLMVASASYACGMLLRLLSWAHAQIVGAR